MKKSNSKVGCLGIIAIMMGLAIADQANFGRPEPQSTIYVKPTDTTRPTKTFENEYSPNDSLEQLYDPNNPNYIYDPNDPNKTDEWDGYY